METDRFGLSNEKETSDITYIINHIKDNIDTTILADTMHKIKSPDAGSLLVSNSAGNAAESDLKLDNVVNQIKQTDNLAARAMKKASETYDRQSVDNLLNARLNILPSSSLGNIIIATDKTDTLSVFNKSPNDLITESKDYSDRKSTETKTYIDDEVKKLEETDTNNFLFLKQKCDYKLNVIPDSHAGKFVIVKDDGQLLPTIHSPETFNSALIQLQNKINNISKKMIYKYSSNFKSNEITINVFGTLPILPYKSKIEYVTISHNKSIRNSIIEVHLDTIEFGQSNVIGATFNLQVDAYRNYGTFVTIPFNVEIPANSSIQVKLTNKYPSNYIEGVAEVFYKIL